MFVKGQLSRNTFRLYAKAVRVFKALRDGSVIRTFQSLFERQQKMAARVTPTLQVPAMARVRSRDIRS